MLTCNKCYCVQIILIWNNLHLYYTTYDLYELGSFYQLLYIVAANYIDIVRQLFHYHVILQMYGLNRKKPFMEIQWDQFSLLWDFLVHVSIVFSYFCLIWVNIYLNRLVVVYEEMYRIYLQVTIWRHLSLFIRINLILYIRVLILPIELISI